MSPSHFCNCVSRFLTVDIRLLQPGLDLRRSPGPDIRQIFLSNDASYFPTARRPSGRVSFRSPMNRVSIGMTVVNDRFLIPKSMTAALPLNSAS